MPYIEKDARAKLVPKSDGYPVSPGDLNFQITCLLIEYMKYNGKRYQQINDILGALEGAKLEFYSTQVRAYEDKKCRENSDVYDGDSSYGNLAWAGGFFEGEGCFYAHYYKPRKDGTRIFQMEATLVQKGKQLLDEFKNVVKMGIVYGPNEKGIYTWKSNGKGQAQKLFELLRPWLGNRRQETALKLIERENQQILRPSKEKCKNGHFYKDGSFVLRTQNNKTWRKCLICQMKYNKSRYEKANQNGDVY